MEQEKQVHKRAWRTAVIIALAAVCVGSTFVCVAVAGLIVPHIARLIVGSDYKYLFPASIFLGYSFVVVCDTVGRIILPVGELSVSIVLSFIGPNGCGKSSLIKTVPRTVLPSTGSAIFEDRPIKACSPHYIDEAQALCSRIALMDQGKAARLATPEALIRALGETAVETRTLHPEGGSAARQLYGGPGGRLRSFGRMKSMPSSLTRNRILSPCTSPNRRRRPWMRTIIRQMSWPFSYKKMVRYRSR